MMSIAASRELRAVPDPSPADDAVAGMAAAFEASVDELVAAQRAGDTVARPVDVAEAAMPALTALCRSLRDGFGCTTVRAVLIGDSSLVRVTAAHRGEPDADASGAPAPLETAALHAIERDALEQAATVVGTNGGLAAVPITADGIGAAGVIGLSFDGRGSVEATLIAALERLAAAVGAVLAAEARRQRGRSLLGAFIATSPYPAAVADPQGRVEWVNDAYARLAGSIRGMDAGVGLPGIALPSPAPAGVSAPVSRIAVGEVGERREDGSAFSAEETLFAVRDREGRTVNLVAVYEDLTDRAQAEARARHAARHDSLTGLPNRYVFGDRLGVAAAQAKRSRRMVALLLLDLHGFTMVNATYGHAAGDRLLKLAAERLLACVRDVDTVARLGSDEFAVVQTDVGHVQDVARLAQRIVDAFADGPFDLGGAEVSVGVNVGITVYPVDGAEADAMLGNADVALRRAVGEGRNNFVFYTPAMGEQVRERLDLVAGIREAIDRDELVLHYQPQIDVGSGRIVGTEALLRWVRPGVGMVPPGAFIHAAEQSGLIVPIGNWAMREACRQIGRWRGQGLEAPPVAVNMSAVQLHRRDLLETIVEILRETGVDPEMLEIEITESMLMQDAERASATLRRLSDLGIHIAVDDFGTGHSSLNYLKRLPVDKLKIDRSFVREVPGNFQDSAISKAIIGLGHSLALKVIAEGVEIAPQLDFLTSEGCDEVQGFLFARPQPADLLPALMARGPLRPH